MTLVREAVSDTIAEEVHEIVAKKTRWIMREKEDQLTAIIRAAIRQGIRMSAQDV
jgi:hypothetical protein